MQCRFCKIEFKTENEKIKKFFVGGNETMVENSRIVDEEDKSPETFQIYYKCSRGHEWKENRKPRRDE